MVLKKKRKSDFYISLRELKIQLILGHSVQWLNASETLIFHIHALHSCENSLYHSWTVVPHSWCHYSINDSKCKIHLHIIFPLAISHCESCFAWLQSQYHRLDIIAEWQTDFRSKVSTGQQKIKVFLGLSSV